VHFIILSSGTGNTVIKAVAVLKEHNVAEENIILSNLFCTPFAAKSVMAAFPQVRGYFL
jgi:uracil phosphoribosyltransferase